MAESEEEKSKSTWPGTKDAYELGDIIGHGATCVVQRALCKSKGVSIAIKRIDLEQYNSTIDEILKEIQFMGSCFHDNLCTYRTSFVVRNELWVVMDLMSGGSLLDILKHQLSKGIKGGLLSEDIIATVLREVLLGLEYLHNAGQIHRDLKAGNILLGGDGAIKLADFGVSSFLVKPGERPESKKKPRKTFVGTPCWMAPEVMDQTVGYDVKADIWSFGITALELATGTAPYAKFPPLKVLMLTMENPPPTLEVCGELNSEDYSKYSKPFRKMIEKCLLKDPEKRPTASELLKHPFFKKTKDKEFLKEILIPLSPDIKLRGKSVRRVKGASGRMHKTEEGDWVWSDDEFVEETIPEEKEKGKLLSAPKPSDSEVHSREESAEVVVPVPNNIPPVSERGTSNVAIPPQPSQGQPPKKVLIGSTTAVPSPAILDLQQRHQSITQQLTVTMNQLMAVTQQQQQLLIQQQQGQSTPEMQMTSMQLLEQSQGLAQQQQMLMVEQQRINLTLQQAQMGLAMGQMNIQPQQSQSAPPTSSSIPPTKLSLRIRDANNQLKDIKFDFKPSQDSADGIASDLLSAGLIDARNLVVVAANIMKILENTTLEKVTFQLSLPDLQQEVDEKKLIGYAQISRITPNPKTE